MNLPIEKKLANEMQLRIARLQDSSIKPCTTWITK